MRPSSRSWSRRVVVLVALAAAFGQSHLMAGETQPKGGAFLASQANGNPGKKAGKAIPKAGHGGGIRRPGIRNPGKHALKPAPRSKLQRQTKRRAESKPSLTSLSQPALPHPDSIGIEDRWRAMQGTLQPARVIRLIDEFERDFPASRFSTEARMLGAAARQALAIQRSVGLSGDFFDDPFGDPAFRKNLLAAVRGDSDAAYRVALAYRTGAAGVAASFRRMEQWLRFSAELGSGRASWELAEIYNVSGLVADAARFEAKALELGYRPGIRLPTRGY